MTNNDDNEPAFAKNTDTIRTIIYDSLKFIEAKHGILLVFNTTALWTVLSEFDYKNCISTCILLVAASFWMVSVVYSLFSFYPKRGVKKKPASGEKNLFFTEEISQYSIQELNDILRNNSKKVSVDMLRWTVATAQVAARKYKLFRKAMLCTTIGFLIAAATIIFCTLLNL